MRIALVSPYDFAYPGGVANHITNLDRCLTRMGHDVRIIAPASARISGFGERFIPIGKPRAVPSSGSISRITLSLRLAKDIKATLEREKFDIIHLHEPFMPMLCSAVLRFSGSTNVGTFHASNGSPGYLLGWPFTWALIRRRAHKLHGRIAVSRPARNYASTFIPGPYHIIPNGIDLEHFSPTVAPVEEFNDGKRNIVFVGRLERRKGLIYLIKAYRQIKPEFPASRLIIVGPGTRLRKIYQGWVARARLEDVHFIGYAHYADLPRYYQSADIFCAPATSRESFGIVLLEAMAMGKPIVASNIEGYASVMTNGEEGWLVPPKNSKALANALLTLLRDAKLSRQMGARGQMTARKYGWDMISRRVLDFYEKVLEERLGKRSLVGAKG